MESSSAERQPLSRARSHALISISLDALRAVHSAGHELCMALYHFEHCGVPLYFVLLSLCFVPVGDLLAICWRSYWRSYWRSRTFELSVLESAGREIMRPRARRRANTMCHTQEIRVPRCNELRLSHQPKWSLCFPPEPEKCLQPAIAAHQLERVSSTLFVRLFRQARERAR